MAETTLKRAQRIVNRLLHPLGLHLSRASQTFGMDDLLANAARQGINPGTIIDVGASDGIWSLGARRIYPAAKYLLFEPLEEQRAALAGLNRRLGFEIVHAAAGATPGTIGFHVGDDMNGSAVAAETNGLSVRQVRIEKVDAAVAARAMPGPYLLKLDTHGHELPVLEGATATLIQTEFLVIEAYNFRLTEGCLRFHELCAWMETRGFRCAGLADPMLRPVDGILWQMDLAFARADNPLFQRGTYR